MSDELTWIRRGLRFECQPDCGKCCTQQEREGSVFLEPEDIERLAKHLGMTSRAFATEYTTSDYGELELAIVENGDCRFLDLGRCTVYEARPSQCRTYPFLPLDGYTPIEAPNTWRYEKKFCPGIGKGRLFKKEEITAILRGRDHVAGFDDE